MRTNRRGMRLMMVATVVLGLIGTAMSAADKPLKVYILAGQSNMEGPADIKTIPYIGEDPLTAPMYKEMVGADGKPVVCKNVWISSLTGDDNEIHGKLTEGYGSLWGENVKKSGHCIGPEFTFGIYMSKAVKEPILLIKTAWGGKSLSVNFRPPSAGPYEQPQQTKDAWSQNPKGAHGIPEEEDRKAWREQMDAETGVYYKLMIKHVNFVLGEIKRVYPEYKGQGYEIAGFVWLQGWNDMCDNATYPYVSGVPDYSKYSEWLADLIRDVRKDLKAPKMPFVIGVMGVDGVFKDENTNPGMCAFRKAMTAPSLLPGFKGNVVAVQTAPFWDAKLGLIDANRYKVNQMRHFLDSKHKDHLNADGLMTDAQKEEYMKKFEAKLISPEDKARWERGASNAGYHYLGCAKTFALMGKAFAEALVSLHKTNIDDYSKGVVKDDTHDWTLGPTGARGWMTGKELETTNARYILVTKVHPRSPANGILDEGDVILGVGGKLFSEDARKVFGRAITEAEKTDNKGKLSLIRWRKGEQEDVVVSIPVLGSYSATSPLNCPKTAKIVDAQCKYLLKQGFGDGIQGSVNALGALSTGRPEFAGMLEEYARKAGPPDLKLKLEPSAGMAGWFWGYNCLFLAEYYLSTKRVSLLPAIREYAVNIAKGQSGAGSWGHGMAWPQENQGKLQGALGGYGAINQAGLICFMSLILSRECGVKDPEVDAAIERSRKFFGFYVNRGTIPYGDHNTGWVHDDNGKSSLAAVVFDLLGDKKSATFFSRMTVASCHLREPGHTGNYWSFLWGAPGAWRSGQEAASAFLKELHWFLDMERKWDGSSEYQGGAGWSAGSEHQYGGWDCTGARLLANSLPLKKLRITGKGAGVAEQVTGEDLRKVLELDKGILWSTRETLYKGRPNEELFQLLGSWSPVASERAAKGLADKNDDSILPRIMEMLKSPDMNARYGACRVMEQMRGRASSAVPALTELLDEKDMELRIRAISALSKIGKPASPSISKLLLLSNKRFPEDPRQWTQRCIGEMFYIDYGGLLASKSLEGVDRQMLLSAVEEILRNDDGRVRGIVAQYISTRLTLDEVRLILPTILKTIEEVAPSGEMWGAWSRVVLLEMLSKNHVKEGIPLLLKVTWEQPQWASENRTEELMKSLEGYGIYAKEAIPELKKFAEWCRTEKDFPDWARDRKRKHVEEAINRIETSTEKPELISLPSTHKNTGI